MRINEEIRAREVRVIANGGEQLGIMSSRDALKLALENHLDLVEIAPTAKPPVCRIMDYGKYRYEQQKREKEARRNKRPLTLKKLSCVPVSRTMTSMLSIRMQYVSWKMAIR